MTARGPVTVIVGRNRIHSFGSNGWDLVLWAISWLTRIVTREKRWRVSLRMGEPRLWSGTQQLLYTEVLDDEAKARQRAAELVGVLEGDDWPIDAANLEVPSGEWLAPTSRAEAAVRLAAVIAFAVATTTFALLGGRAPSLTASLVLLPIATVAITSAILAVNLSARRRHGGKGLVIEVFSVRHLLASSEMLGADRRLGFAGLVILAMAVVAAVLYSSMAAL